MRPILCALLVILFSACSGNRDGVVMNTQIQQGTMPEGGTFAGVWFSNWGEMTIEIEGNNAVGQFCDEENNRYGRLSGTVRGDVMRFHWTTNDVSMGNAPRTSEGSAIVQIHPSQAGETQTYRLEGTWGFDRSNDGGGPLRGDRSGHRSVRFLRGAYSTPCVIRETAEAPPPMSTEDLPDNPDDDGGELPPDLADDEGGEGGGVDDVDEEPLDDFEI